MHGHGNKDTASEICSPLCRFSNIFSLTLEYAGGRGGDGFCPLSTDMACIPSIFIKTSLFLVKAV